MPEERYSNGERILTAFVKATVNIVVSRGFAKKQSMQWSKQGAHFTPANPNPRRHTARCVHQVLSGHRRQRYPVIASA
jgi:hypothetical protein